MLLATPLGARQCPFLGVFDGITGFLITEYPFVEMPKGMPISFTIPQ
jgi:hypothetical protein